MHVLTGFAQMALAVLDPQRYKGTYSWGQTERQERLCFAQPLASPELWLWLRLISWSGIERRDAEAVTTLFSLSIE